MKGKIHWYDSLFILLFFYLFVLQIQAIWSFTIDDMYISLRYAKNWAAGDGLLWNINDAPVEGYSNFSFVALGALSLIMQFNPIFILKTAGLLGLLATCISLFYLTRFWFERSLSLIPCITLLLYKGQIIWAVSGLETSVYEAFICSAVFCAFRAQGYNFFPKIRTEYKNNYFIYAGLLLFGAGLTRPEAPVFMILFVLLFVWERPTNWRGVVFFVATLCGTYVPYFLWRWAYFGFLFPNSVYCKGFSETFSSIDLYYLKFIWPFVLLAIPACIKAADRRHYFLWLPSLIYLVLLAKADPIVAFDNRLFLPVFALLLPLSLQGYQYLILLFSKPKKPILFIFLSAILLLGLFMPWMSLSDYYYFSKNPVKGSFLRLNVVEWLNKHAQANDKVVLSDAGLIPYLSDLYFIDSYCLNNLSMAHYPNKKRYEQFCYQILLEKPEIIILTSLIEQGSIKYTPSDSCLKELLSKRSDYKLSEEFISTDSKSKYRYELFSTF